MSVERHPDCPPPAPGSIDAICEMLDRELADAPDWSDESHEDFMAWLNSPEGTLVPERYR